MDTYYPKPDAPPRVYTAPESEIAPVMRFSDWVVTLIISLIPLVNVIVLFIWALSDTTNPNRRNFSLAMLLLIAAYCVLIALYIGYIAGMISAFSNILQ